MESGFQRRRALGRRALLLASATLFAVSGLMACGGSKPQPTFGTLPVVEARFGQGSEEKPETQVEKPAPPPAPRDTDPPDPPPASSIRQVEFSVQFNKGEIVVLSERRFRLAHPEPTARRMGRFALELWLGSALLERVRFDFPLLAASPADGDDALEAGLTAQTKVVVPELRNATRARILDRKTRKSVELPWPPAQPKPEEDDSSVSEGVQEPASEDAAESD